VQGCPSVGIRVYDRGMGGVNQVMGHVEMANLTGLEKSGLHEMSDNCDIR